MGRQAPQPVSDSAPAPCPPDDARLRAGSAWAGRLARTLKTCRLYDQGNPTAVRFREELATSLAALLQEQGPLTLTFTSGDVLWGEASLYPARSRDDNLGLPFYRDGIRALAFLPGIEPREVDAVVDAVLRVTGRGGEDADLVTLLWDAELPHVRVDSVSMVASADEDGGEASESGAEGPCMPWPGGGAGGSEPAGTGAAPAGAPAAGGAASAAAPVPRSDDWDAADLAAWEDGAFEELAEAAAGEAVRLRAECESEREANPVAGALALLEECATARPSEEDREELARLAARLLQEAMAAGAWREARQAARLLAGWACGAPLLERVRAELARPGAETVAGAVCALDAQGAQGAEDLRALAGELGAPAVEWLMGILAESRQKRTRLALTRGIADLVREEPERLAPWLAHEHWYVVRNVVHVLGLIGGPAVVGLLRTAATHPERRVRLEVVAAFAHVDAALARPVLLTLLEGADTDVACAVLHRLAATRDPEVAQVLLERVLAPDFQRRPDMEQRALWSTLARAAGDEVLPRLEDQLHEGRWFSSGHEAHRRALARCIARVGTPAAREVLERGARSRNAGVRAACAEALPGGHPHA